MIKLSHFPREPLFAERPFSLITVIFLFALMCVNVCSVFPIFFHKKMGKLCSQFDNISDGVNVSSMFPTFFSEKKWENYVANLTTYISLVVCPGEPLTPTWGPLI